MSATRGAGGVLSRAALSTIGLAVQGLARFIYTIMIGRFVGEAGLADASALLSVSVWLALALPAGLGTAASRYLAMPEYAGAAVRQLNRWFWIWSPFLALLAVPISLWLVGDIVAALCCALLVFAYNAYSYTRGVMMGEDRILRATIADTITSAMAITVLVLVLLGGAHWALLLPLAVGFGVFAMFTRPNVLPTLVTSNERTMFRVFVRDAVIGGMAVGGLLPATMVFVRAFDSPVQAGLFAAALSLATPANMVAQATKQVLLPHYSRMSHDPAAMRRSQRKMFVASTVLFVVAFGALAVLAPFLLPLVYGDRFAGGTTAMQVLLGIVFLISATSSPSAFLAAAGQQRVQSMIWIVALIVGTLAMLLLSPSLGMWGAMIGYGIGGGGGALAVILYGNLLPLARVRPLGIVAEEHKD